MRTLQRRLVRVAAAAVAVIGWGAVIVAPTGASAAIITTPDGLLFGDQYRLGFVTTTTLDATSTNIADYNAFVTTAANSQPALAALGATWTAIGSTSTIDARDNTGTNPTSVVPIYLLDGTTRIVDPTFGIWDGEIDLPWNIFEDGTLAPDAPIWTGTQPDGTKDDSFSMAFLGSPSGFALTGQTSRADFGWVDDLKCCVLAASQPLSFYALSSPLTVVPLPGALILFGSGLACLAVLRRRNRSVRPA